MAWRGRARGVFPLALGLLAAAEALRPAGAVLKARGSTHPEPPRLRTAATGPTRREHAFSSPLAILQRPGGAAGAVALTQRYDQVGGDRASGCRSRGVCRLGRQVDLTAARQATQAHTQCSG